MARQLGKRLLLMLSGAGLRLDRGDWLLPGQLLGCGYPRSDAALRALRDRDIDVLVNLHERQHTPERLAAYELTSVHILVTDFTAPTPEQLYAGVAAIDGALAEGRRVAVHCGGGLGRTGTLLACYLVARDASADDAIARVRELRPGSIETRAQIEAIRAFAAGRRRETPAPRSS